MSAKKAITIPARLIAAAQDHALFAAALCQGTIRWEWLPGHTTGEICVDGLRYSAHLDQFGVPQLDANTRAAIQKARK